MHPPAQSRKPSASAGFNLLELLVVLAVLAGLAWLALPGMRDIKDGSRQTQVLSNMRQLYTVAFTMATDGTTTGATNFAWPGDLDGSFATWATNLVQNDYIGTNDFCKLLSAPGKVTRPGQIPLANTNAVLVYAMRDESPGSAVFLTSANFTNTPTGGVPPLKNALPFGQTNFVVFRKGGDGAILKGTQAGPAYTNLIGSYVPLCTGPAALPMATAVHDVSWLPLVAVLAVLLAVGTILALRGGRRVSPRQAAAQRANHLVSCMRQLYLATLQMSFDARENPTAGLGWPGDTGGGFATWTTNLVEAGYLKPGDLAKLLAGTAGLPPRASWLGAPAAGDLVANTNTIRVYAIREDSAPDTIFLTSANFLHDAQGGAVDPASPLLDGQYFVIMTRDGKGTIVPIPSPDDPEPAAHQISLGAYAPPCA